MMSSSVKARLATALGSAILLCTAVEHDLYLKPMSGKATPGSAQTMAMHNGDSFPGSDGPPVLERLRDSNVISAEGSTALRDIRVDGTAALADYQAPKGSFVVTTRTVPNFIELGVFSFERYLKHEELAWVISWRSKNGESLKSGRELYSKHAKALMNLDHGDFALAPVGHTAEIVLLENPTERKVGDTLAVRVLFRGKPAADQPVEVCWAKGDKMRQYWAGRTNGSGNIAIPIESEGFWKLHTIVMERRAERSEADWESFWASTTFHVGKAR